MAKLSNILIFIGVLALCFGIVFAAETSEPDYIEIYFGENITNLTPSYIIGEEIVLDLKVNFSGPILKTTNLKGSVADYEVYRNLMDVLDYQGVYYNTDEGAKDLVGSTLQADFAFNDAGSQVVYLRVDSNTDTFESLNLDVSGSGSPPPKMP